MKNAPLNFSLYYNNKRHACLKQKKDSPKVYKHITTSVYEFAAVNKK